MAKAKKHKTASPRVKMPSQPALNLNRILEKPVSAVLFFLLLFVIMAFLYQPMVFEGKEPGGSDIVSGVGKTHQMKLQEKETGKRPLWNSYMFGGMPMYHRFSPRAYSLDTLLNNLDFLGDWRLWFFLAGALGIFLLVKFLGLSAGAGMVAAAAFILMPHFQALIIVGHFAKFRALMWMPYVVLTSLMLVQRRTLLSAALFALALALQFRTQHYQIMFYTILAALFLGLPPLFKLIQEKYWKELGKALGLGVAALILTFLIVAQNLLSIQEYTPYSTRAGNALSIEENVETQQENKGVGFDYATGWSYSVSELWNLIIPRFHGGTSSERYTGDAVPQLRNRELPTYWGSMPFTQSYEYLGIAVFFLALTGVFFQWRRWEVKSLAILSLLAVCMALGSHFAPLYRLFFYYVPFFDKFRVPMMILTLLMFTAVLLAAFGLSFLQRADYRDRDFRKKIYILLGVLSAILIIPLLFAFGFDLSRAGEAQRYGAEVVEMFRKIRLEMLRDSALKSLLFLLLCAGVVFAAQKEWLRSVHLPVIFLAIVVIDLFLLDSHYVKGNFVDPDGAERRQYQATALEKTILQDKSIYRVFPVGQLFQDTHWSYYFQSLGGYSAAKMQTIQEIVENNLYQRVEGQLPFNWNVLDMMNVKYLVANQPLPPSSHLQQIYGDESRKLYVYRNTGMLPRAFFVDSIRVIKDGVERLKVLNRPDFDPATTALLEQQPSLKTEAPDSAIAQISSIEPDHIELQVYTDKPALLVLSEMFYPNGWSAVLDNGEPLPIYKANHLLRSVAVPAGSHKIVFNFHPASFYAGVRISTIALIFTYVVIALLLFRHYRRRKTAKPVPAA
ncbi:MAG: YfhO family protein [Calditrichia bacterium]